MDQGRGDPAQKRGLVGTLWADCVSSAVLGRLRPECMAGPDLGGTESPAGKIECMFVGAFLIWSP